MICPAEEPIEKFQITLKDFNLDLKDLTDVAYKKLMRNVLPDSYIAEYLVAKILDQEIFYAKEDFSISSLKKWKSGEAMKLSDLVHINWTPATVDTMDWPVKTELPLHERVAPDLGKSLVLLLYCLFGQGLSDVDYFTNVRKLPDLLKETRHDLPLKLPQNDLNFTFATYESVRYNKNLKFLSAFCDYFAMACNNANYHRCIRVSTMTSRYENQAAALALLSALAYFPRGSAQLLRFIGDPIISNEIRIMTEYQPLLNCYHFWPYSYAVGRITESSFSSVSSPQAFTFLTVFLGCRENPSHFNKISPRGNLYNAISQGYHTAEIVSSMINFTPNDLKLVKWLKEMKVNIGKNMPLIGIKILAYRIRLDKYGFALTPAELSALKSKVPRSAPFGSIGQLIRNMSVYNKTEMPVVQTSPYLGETKVPPVAEIYDRGEQVLTQKEVDDFFRSISNLRICSSSSIPF